MLALGLGYFGCSSDDDAEEPVGVIAGGWSNEAENRYVCVADDRRMWLGDSPGELEGPNPCTVDDSGTAFHCPASQDQAAFDGSLETSGDQLTLEIVPCPTDPAECRATYVRDSSLRCD